MLFTFRCSTGLDAASKDVAIIGPNFARLRRGRLRGLRRLSHTGLLETTRHSAIQKEGVQRRSCVKIMTQGGALTLDCV